MALTSYYVVITLRLFLPLKTWVPEVTLNAKKKKMPKESKYEIFKLNNVLGNTLFSE